jgi:hypothetical protein
MNTKSHPFDELNEWASMTDSEIERVISANTIAILSEICGLLAYCDEMHRPDISRGNFVAVVREMRDRKKRGANELGQAIIEASDWFDKGHLDKARAVYEKFLSSCKIQFYRKIAQQRLVALREDPSSSS